MSSFGIDRWTPDTKESDFSEQEESCTTDLYYDGHLQRWEHSLQGSSRSLLWEDYHELEAGLSYLADSRTVWAAEEDLASKQLSRQKPNNNKIDFRGHRCTKAKAVLYHRSETKIVVQMISRMQWAWQVIHWVFIPITSSFFSQAENTHDLDKHKTYRLLYLLLVSTCFLCVGDMWIS